MESPEETKHHYVAFAQTLTGSGIDVMALDLSYQLQQAVRRCARWEGSTRGYWAFIELAEAVSPEGALHKEYILWKTKQRIGV